MTDGPGDLRGAQGVQVGDHNIQTNIFGGTITVSTPVEVSWPVRVGAVPLLAGCYQRRAESRLLSEAIDEGGTAVVTQVLSGLGGVGKTQLAAAYARSRTDTDLLAWVNAGGRDAIVSGYAEVAARLGHPVTDDAERAAEWLLTWMQTATERSWLIVLDDLADPADLRGLWPGGPRGRTVITTRRTDAALTRAGRRRVEVGLFTPGQARAYLAERLEADPDDERMWEADELAADLGHLPLALAQAGAFILDRGDTCVGYRARLADRRRRLAELFPPDALADDYHDTVAATWSISIEAADALPPAGLARPVLELLSVLDPSGIPADLLTTPAAIEYASAHGPAPPRDGQDLLDALHHLARLSLITLDPAAGPAGVRVHGLVQRAAAEHLNPAQITALHRAAAGGLLEIWPKIERDTRLGQVLRANASALIDKAQANLWQPTIHPLLWRTGNSLGKCGLVDAAIGYWTRMLSDADRYVGAEQLATLAVRSKLAWWRGEAGDPAGAATAFEELRVEKARTLGPDHALTLDTRSSLAHWRGQAGDPVGAATAFEQLLTDRLRVLGPDHPDILATRNNVAHWRGHAGDPVGAATAFEQLLADQVRILSPNDPLTFITRSNLALVRGQAGDPASAVHVLEQLLADQVRVLGPAHPHTLITRNNLAYHRGQAGDPAGAATAFEQLLTDRLRVLGPDHPDTLTTRHNLAGWRGEAGDPAGAATAFEQLLTDNLRVLGPDHPNTLTTRSNLARWRGQAGDPAGAATALEQLLTDRLRVLGPDHPDTFTTQNDLARWRGQAGDPAGAATALELLLTDNLRVLGPDHPNTLTTRNNLACYRGSAGDPAGAVAALEQLLTDNLRVLGPNHPNTLTTRNNLARWRGEAGDPAAAVAALGPLLTDHIRVLGPDHPATFITRNNLAYYRCEAGECAEAAGDFEQLLADCLRVLGPEHPTAHAVRNSIARWRARASQPDQEHDR
ncbi:tetratricopeptide repeat protein [Pseudonocardia sp. DSM 110487]|uniref:tetratricopeptide repeat protein n=1 Tax=Pseudonocardia sp. DSM 110487 TaxID=2865833 RepID=UPI001C695339|nr:tetratricopeptide repeat protein [Pseudonocardia sp. DSM 110487]QYN35256.1 tetratricopeptide repeat protein [Pseudonocardia sp. DSM 110487]